MSLARLLVLVAALAAGGCELILGISDPSLASGSGADAGGGGILDGAVPDGQVTTGFICDLVNQTNCAISTDACYFEQGLPHGSFCAPVPSMSLGAQQGSFCGGNPCGNDSCAVAPSRQRTACSMNSSRFCGRPQPLPVP